MTDIYQEFYNRLLDETIEPEMAMDITQGHFEAHEGATYTRNEDGTWNYLEEPTR